MQTVENNKLAPFGEFVPDYSNATVPNSAYYYSVTGDVIPGANNDLSFFPEFNPQQPFPTGTTTDIRNQGNTWLQLPAEQDPNPSWDFGSLLAPVIDAFSNVVENFTNVIENFTNPKKPSNYGYGPKKN